MNLRNQLLRAADRIVRRRADCFDLLLSPQTPGGVNHVCMQYLWLSAEWWCIRQALRLLA